MSQENVEVVRRIDAAIHARDMEALLAEHQPDVEIVVLRSEIEGPYQGHDGLRRMATDMFEADFKQRIDEIRDLGEKRVLVLGHQRATVSGALGSTGSRRSSSSSPGRSHGSKRSGRSRTPSWPPGCGTDESHP